MVGFRKQLERYGFTKADAKAIAEAHVVGKMPEEQAAKVVDLFLKADLFQLAIKELGFHMTPMGVEMEECIDDAIAAWKVIRESNPK